MTEDKKGTCFKLVLLGESSVGKSSLVLRFCRNQFNEYQESTIGAAFLTQNVTLSDATVIKFEIWDTAGQERYKSLAPMYYRGSPAAIVVYDITNMESYDKSKYWVKELQRQGSNIIIALAGNKCDLQDKRIVDKNEAQLYAEQNGLIFLETSAKIPANVNEIFTKVAQQLPKNQIEEESNINKNVKNLIPKAGGGEEVDAGSKKCC